MDEGLGKSLVIRLDAIIKLLVFGLTSNKNQKEQIRLLSQSGFPPREIADMLGTTRNTVSVTLASLKKQKGSKKKGK